MANATKVQDGGGPMLDHSAAGGLAAGQIVEIVSMVVIASREAAANEVVGCFTNGVFYMPKATGGGSAIPKGTKVYWDDGGGVVSASSTNNIACGHAAAASADGDATQLVNLSQIA